MINVGIIGFGRIGKVHCESIMRYVKGATVKAVADPFLNPDAVEWAKSLGIKEFYTDYKKILADKRFLNLLKFRKAKLTLMQHETFRKLRR